MKQILFIFFLWTLSNNLFGQDLNIDSWYLYGFKIDTITVTEINYYESDTVKRRKFQYIYDTSSNLIEKNSNFIFDSFTTEKYTYNNKNELIKTEVLNPWTPIDASYEKRKISSFTYYNNDGNPDKIEIKNASGDTQISTYKYRDFNQNNNGEIYIFHLPIEIETKINGKLIEKVVIDINTKE